MGTRDSVSTAPGGGSGAPLSSPFLEEELFSEEAAGSAPRSAVALDSPFLLGMGEVVANTVPMAEAMDEPAAELEGEVEDWLAEMEAAETEPDSELEDWLAELEGEEDEPFGTGSAYDLESNAEAEGVLLEDADWGTAGQTDRWLPEAEWDNEAQVGTMDQLEDEVESAYDDAFEPELELESVPQAELEELEEELEAELEEELEAELEAEDDRQPSGSDAVGVALELETSPDVPANIATFAAELGVEWSRRRGGSPTGEAIGKWLVQDYRDTMVGAKERFGKRYAEADLGAAWMVSRREQMLFQTASRAGIRGIGRFVAPTGAALVSSPLIGSSEKAKVAPLLVQFVEELKRRYSGSLSVYNYRGHGGTGFSGRGHSLDMELRGRDSRGFYPPQEALRFLRAVGDSARAVGAQWRVIYNDFSVADAINRETGVEHVIFVGKVRRNASGITGLNWHGPHPLILHFHLDLAPTSGTGPTSGPAGTGAVESKPAPSAPTAKPAGKPAAELVRFAQRVLNAAEGERLVVDGVPGRLTAAALTRFRKKYDLGAGGALDAATQLALVQRALEEIEQQSMFAQPGTRDARTDEAIATFRLGRGLGRGATIDAATREALGKALPGAATGAARGILAGAAGSAQASPAAVSVRASTLAVIQKHRSLAEAASRRYGVDTALILGVIAAESGGNPALVAKSGYTGLMQAGKGAAHKQPATSIDAGTRKLRDFRIIMEGILRKLGMSYDRLPEPEQLRLLALAYNAGPVTVAKALQYAAQAGDPTRWLQAEHYKRALLFTGAYSLNQAAASCLEGVSAADRESRKREAARVRDHWRLGTKKVNWRNLPDPPNWAAVQPTLPAFLVCAIDFKHRNSPRYATKILAYRDRLRGG